MFKRKSQVKIKWYKTPASISYITGLNYIISPQGWNEIKSRTLAFTHRQRYVWAES